MTNRVRFSRGKAAAAVALTIGIPLALAAAAGGLDPAFNGNGRAVVAFDRALMNLNEPLAVQPDGKIVVAAALASPGDGNDIVVTRLSADGTVDAGFGTGGRVTIDLGSRDWPSAVAIQPDGKILVAGSSSGPGHLGFLLVRYLPDGALDVSFGSGGIVQTVLADTDTLGFAMALDGAGRIFMAGSAQQQQFAVAAYDANGSLIAQTITRFTDPDDGPNFAEAHAIAIDRNGDVLVAGWTGWMGYDFAFARYSPGLDLIEKKTIDAGGSLDYAHGIAVQSDGGVVLAGESDDKLTLVRMVAGGLDPSFGTGGILYDAALSGASAVAVDAHDSLVVANGVATGQFALTRVLANGRLDASFGSGGTAITSFGTDDERARALAIQSDGKIVAAGRAGNNMAVARYLAVENHAPAAIADVYAAASDGQLTQAAPGVLGNDRDEDGDPITAA